MNEYEGRLKRLDPIEFRKQYEGTWEPPGPLSDAELERMERRHVKGNEDAYRLTMEVRRLRAALAAAEARGACGMVIDRGEMLVEIGMQRVVIDKLFGPHIFANLRITPDLERGWIIERQCGSSGDWVEWVTIPEQLESDFVDGSVRDGG